MGKRYKSPKDVKIGDKTLDQLIINHKAWVYDIKQYPGVETDNRERLVLCPDKLLKLEKIDFSGYEYFLDLSYSILENISFIKCKFDSVSFHRALIVNCAFNECTFKDNTNIIERSDFDGAVLKMCIFDKCIFGDNIRFVNTCFKSCNFFDSDININLEMADIIDCGFDSINFGDKDIFSSNILNNGNTFTDCNNIPYIPMSCPSEGSFIGWKKIRFKSAKIECKTLNIDQTVYETVLVKLKIPASAKRSSALSRKCRCSKAKVIGIYNLDGTITKMKSVTNITRINDLINREQKTEYKVGEYVYPDSFDENRWNECSNGIHFFMDIHDAIRYMP